MNVTKGDHPSDPRGLIFESYRIDGITIEECRTIFLDWAISLDDEMDMKTHVQDLLESYGAQGDHPMTAVLNEGLTAAQSPKRRGGARRQQRG